MSSQSKAAQLPTFASVTDPVRKEDDLATNKVLAWIRASLKDRDTAAKLLDEGFVDLKPHVTDRPSILGLVVRTSVAKAVGDCFAESPDLIVTVSSRGLLVENVHVEKKSADAKAEGAAKTD